MAATALVAGVYEMGPAIGSGAAGVVYRGWDFRSGQQVAIKAIRTDQLAGSPALLDGFRSEVQALHRLHHPNIIRLLAAERAGDTSYLVMEYAGGGSLADLLCRQRQLPVERALAIGQGVAAALAHVHALGILHRDVKPSNILFSEDGTPRLSDFGLARLPHARPASDTEILGTFQYISPEAWHASKLDGRADIYSLGVVLFEVLAGQRPFEGDSPWDIMWAIQNVSLPDVCDYRDGLPAGLGDLVRRMLARDVAARPASARLVQAELARMQTNGAARQPERSGLLPRRAVRAPVSSGSGAGPASAHIAVLPLVTLRYPTLCQSL